MTELVQAALLGVLQGATEFLPVSSSGHLVLGPALLDWPDPGLAFNAAVHWATALAVLAYTRADWLRIAGSLLGTARAGRPPSGQAAADVRLCGLLAVATLPAAAAGLALDDPLEELFGAPRIAAAMLLVTATILAAAELLTRRRRHLAPGDLGQISLAAAVLIGAAQAIAIVPGISRSGATIAAGMLAGQSRGDAARFSFLLAVPIIFGAGILEVGALATREGLPAGMLVGAATAGIVGYAAIGGLMAYLRRGSLWPFSVYTAAVGLAALTLLR